MLVSLRLIWSLLIGYLDIYERLLRRTRPYPSSSTPFPLSRSRKVMYPSTPSRPHSTLLPASRASPRSPRSLSCTLSPPLLDGNSTSFDNRSSFARRSVQSSPLAGPVVYHQHLNFHLPTPPNASDVRDPTGVCFQPTSSHTPHEGVSPSSLPGNTKRKSRKLVRRFLGTPSPHRPNLNPLPPTPPLLTRITTTETSPSGQSFSVSEIPRFTRRALWSPNVVLPLSVKEYQRRHAVLPGAAELRSRMSALTPAPVKKVEKEALNRYPQARYYEAEEQGFHQDSSPRSSMESTVESMISDSSRSSLATILDSQEANGFLGRYSISLVTKRVDPEQKYYADSWR